MGRVVIVLIMVTVMVVGMIVIMMIVMIVCAIEEFRLDFENTLQISRELMVILSDFLTNDFQGYGTEGVFIAALMA